MRCFDNIAKLIRTKRIQHSKGYSQSELSHMLGYKNGQFISNVERALCNIPLKMLKRVSEILDIPTEDLKKAILLDHETTLDNYLNGGSELGSVESKKRQKANLKKVKTESSVQEVMSIKTAP